MANLQAQKRFRSAIFNVCPRIGGQQGSCALYLCSHLDLKHLNVTIPFSQGTPFVTVVAVAVYCIWQHAFFCCLFEQHFQVFQNFGLDLEGIYRISLRSKKL